MTGIHNYLWLKTSLLTIKKSKICDSKILPLEQGFKDMKNRLCLHSQVSNPLSYFITIVRESPVFVPISLWLNTAYNLFIKSIQRLFVSLRSPAQLVLNFLLNWATTICLCLPIIEKKYTATKRIQSTIQVFFLHYSLKFKFMPYIDLQLSLPKTNAILAHVTDVCHRQPLSSVKMEWNELSEYNYTILLWSSTLCVSIIITMYGCWDL